MTSYRMLLPDKARVEAKGSGPTVQRTAMVFAEEGKFSMAVSFVDRRFAETYHCMGYPLR